MYEVDDPAVPVEFVVPQYRLEPLSCVNPVTLTMEVTQRPDGLTTFPAFITESLEYGPLGSIKIESNDASLVEGDYVFLVTATEAINSIKN